MLKLKISAQQKKLFEYLLAGLSNAEIGRQLRVCENTVKNMFTELLNLTGMDDRVGLALWVHEHRRELGVVCPCDYGSESHFLRAELQSRELVGA